MKNLYCFIILLVQLLTVAQTKKQIDSVNRLSFETKLEKSSILKDVFLKNALNSVKIGYTIGQAESYSNAALVSYYQGNFEDDLFYALKAITIFEKADASEKLAREYGELGYRMKRIYFMQKGKSIAEKNNYQIPLLSIYNNYGVLKEMQMQNDSALYFYNKGLVLKEARKDTTGLPYSLNNIAGIYVKQKQFSKAAELYERALKMRILKNDQIGIAENHANLGDLFAAQNLHQKAIDSYTTALQKSLKFKYLGLVQYCYEMLSKNHEALKNTDEALKNYKFFTVDKDSILNKDTNSKIAELDVKYETAKKEKVIAQQKADAEQKNIIIIATAVLAVLLALIGFLIYRQQKQKNIQQSQEFALTSAIAEIESQNKLQEQRLSISRDLHDNIGAQLTFIISSVDNIKYGFEITNEKLDNKLTNISSFAKDTILELRDTIWAMNSSEIALEDLEIRINNFIEKAQLSIENISFSFAIEESLKHKKLSYVEGMNLYRTIQEAVNNALKYAEPTIISINIRKENDKTLIQIKDNGKGFDYDTIQKGNGLRNMQKRVEEIGGRFSLTSTNDGTKVEISI
jgi:signal transduction histidine kinase